MHLISCSLAHPADRGDTLIKMPLTRGSYAAFLKAPVICGIELAPANRPCLFSVIAPPSCKISHFLPVTHDSTNESTNGGCEKTAQITWMQQYLAQFPWKRMPRHAGQQGIWTVEAYLNDQDRPFFKPPPWQGSYQSQGCHELLQSCWRCEGQFTARQCFCSILRDLHKVDRPMSKPSTANKKRD